MNPTLSKRLIAARLLLVLLGGCSASPKPPPGEAVVYIPGSRFVTSFESALTLKLDAVSNAPFHEPVFSYEGSAGAPVVRVNPGDTIEVTLRNLLGLSDVTANAVNVHFHGINLSPQRQDNVLTRFVMPGEEIKYKVTIPRSQPPGLYWYHSHSHGEAYWQVTSGMSGALLVRGRGSRLPGEATHESILVLREKQSPPVYGFIPWYARAKMAEQQRLMARKAGIKGYQPIDEDNVGQNRPCSPKRGMYVSIEGTNNGYISIVPGERELIRVLNASASRIFDIAVDGEALGLVAVDGYPVGMFPGTPDLVWVKDFVLPPGGRAEFVVFGTQRPAELRSLCYDSGPTGDPDPEVTLAHLVPSTNRGDKAASPRHPWHAAIDPRLGISNAEVTRKVVFSEDGSGFYINGKTFNMKAMNPMFVVRSGSVEAWAIENDTDEVHVFHIHQVHFIVASMQGRLVRTRYWQDTVLVPGRTFKGRKAIPGRVDVQIDFRDPNIKGTIPFHCHILDHEDGGMMAVVKVV